MAINDLINISVCTCVYTYVCIVSVHMLAPVTIGLTHICLHMIVMAWYMSVFMPYVLYMHEWKSAGERA